MEKRVENRSGKSRTVDRKRAGVAGEEDVRGGGGGGGGGGR